MSTTAAAAAGLLEPTYNFLLVYYLGILPFKSYYLNVAGLGYYRVLPFKVYYNPQNVAIPTTRLNDRAASS